MPDISEVKYPETLIRKRRAVTLKTGEKYCPARYCKEPRRGQCVQKQRPESDNSANYGWEWKLEIPPISSICNSRHSFGSECQRNGRTQSFPSCWYQMGTYTINNSRTMGKKKVPIFVHLFNQDTFCLPCCYEGRIDDITDENKYLLGKTVHNQQIHDANKNKNNMPSR